MSDQPTLLKDMTDAEQKEILFAWLYKRPLQWWGGGWIDCRLGLDALQKNLAYRLKPEPNPGRLYLNIHPGQCCYPTREMADAAAEAHDRVACVSFKFADLYFEWTGGEFDE
jgi:hypothetical protein